MSSRPLRRCTAACAHGLTIAASIIPLNEEHAETGEPANARTCRGQGRSVTPGAEPSDERSSGRIMQNSFPRACQYSPGLAPTCRYRPGVPQREKPFNLLFTVLRVAGQAGCTRSVTVFGSMTGIKCIRQTGPFSSALMTISRSRPKQPSSRCMRPGPGRPRQS